MRKVAALRGRGRAVSLGIVGLGVYSLVTGQVGARMALMALALLISLTAFRRFRKAAAHFRCTEQERSREHLPRP